MSTIPLIVVGINKRGTRMIRVELLAATSAEAMRQVRLDNPDAGALSVRMPHPTRVLAQLAEISPPEPMENPAP